MTYSADEVQKMFQWHQSGMTVQDIADIYGVSRHAISGIFKYRKLTLADNPQLAFSLEDAHQLFTSGMPLDEIAETMCVAPAFLLKKFDEMGMKTDYQNSKWTYASVAQMYKDYRSGMTQIQLSAKYEVQQATISKLFNKFGFRTRKRWTQLDKVTS